MALFGVLTSIKFDDQLGRGAVKIGDVGPDRLLAPEAHSGESLVAQIRPQHAFMVRHMLTELARKFLFQKFASRVFLWPHHALILPSP